MPRFGEDKTLPGTGCSDAQPRPTRVSARHVLRGKQEGSWLSGNLKPAGRTRRGAHAHVEWGPVGLGLRGVMSESLRKDEDSGHLGGQCEDSVCGVPVPRAVTPCGPPVPSPSLGRSGRSTDEPEPGLLGGRALR